MQITKANNAGKIVMNVRIYLPPTQHVLIYTVKKLKEL